MFSKSKNRFLGLAVSIAFASAAQVHTVDAAVASINEANLPINVSNQETAKAVSEQNKPPMHWFPRPEPKLLQIPPYKPVLPDKTIQFLPPEIRQMQKFPAIPMQMRLFLQHKITLPFLLRQKILLLHSQQCRLLCLSKIRHRQKKILILT